MHSKKILFFCFISLLQPLLSIPQVIAQTKSYIIKPDEVGASVQPTMFGVFFEDINMGADGGIYAELIKNRSFEFYEPLMGWSIKGKKEEGDILVLNRKGEKNANPRYLSVKVHNRAKGDLGIINEGFRGIGVKQGLRYDFSVLYRQAATGVKLHLELINSKGEILGSGIFSPDPSGSEWKKQVVSFNANSTDPKAKFAIWFEGNGTIDLDMISLFPSDTWKNRQGGLRADMVQLLADMKPGFIRFPGGCIVEGHNLSVRYQWKKTVGPVEDRELIINRWNNPSALDYYQTFGLGFFEYFQLSEDIGAEPLPILNCGMACQFNTAELVPLDELEPYIQDALDLIEFANGNVNTKWGKLRADMGHPKPFNLKMLGVGNENWGPQYIERLKIFTNVLKQKYPQIKLVTSSGTDPDGKRFDELNTELRKMNADFIDEHYYRNPEWFLSNASRYDKYPRNNTKIFAGEYAAHEVKAITGANRNTLRAAISEAAFLTGLERNADVVYMASYAPLFANTDAFQWAPDLIWVNNLQAYGTPSYYVQKLYSLNKGTNVIPIFNENQVVAGKDSIYASSVIDKVNREVIIKIVNASKKAVQTEYLIEGSKKISNKGKLIFLTGGDVTNANSFKDLLVYPKEDTVQLKNRKVRLKLEANSLNIIKVGFSN